MRNVFQLALPAVLACLPLLASAQTIDPALGVDPRVHYASLTRFGPWDDRNYLLTAEDLELLAPNEAEISEAIPAFYRVALRRAIPELQRSGPAQYPRSALPRFLILYGGYLYNGKLYRSIEKHGGHFVLVLDDENAIDESAFYERLEAPDALTTDVRVTSPNGAAESAVAISPVNKDLVIAGSNGPGSGQNMHYSTNGGATWTAAAALPLGSTCCDPAVEWSSNGGFSYAVTLGAVSGTWFYRSANGGQTWDNLSTIDGDPRREISTSVNTDKEFIHVDRYAGSAHKDNIYVTWHEQNIMRIARSTNFGHTWSTVVHSSSSNFRGIGSDVATDKNGAVYHFWPGYNVPNIWVSKSTDGGASFATPTQVALTQASFIFPIPSMEVREVFVYVSADADLTDGPYGGSIYAAWTDSTAPTSGVPANNHARIRVAYSRNGGSSWTVVTPHPTADATTVDRWHQFLAVAPDGSVHVIFYDTTRDPTRTAVDVYHSVSTNGAQTFSTPTRLTAVQSPNITGSFEFGDYNGLSSVMNQLIAVFTDNRHETGGTGNSVDIYAAGKLLSGKLIVGPSSGGAGRLRLY